MLLFVASWSLSRSFARSHRGTTLRTKPRDWRVLVAKVEDDGRNRASEWKLIGRTSTTLAYPVAIVVGAAIVLAIVYAITQSATRHLDLFRHYLPGV